MILHYIDITCSAILLIYMISVCCHQPVSPDLVKLYLVIGRPQRLVAGLNVAGYLSADE